MALKDTLGKVAGLFVEIPDHGDDEQAAAPDAFDRQLAAIEQQTARLGAPTRPGGARTVEEIVRAAPGPNLDQIHVPAATAATTINADGTLDFGAIYRQANLPASSFTAEQTLDMLAALPKELPLDTKRKTIQVTLASVGKSIGTTPDTIVADASRKLAALSAYTEKLAAETGKVVTETQLEIASMEAQIAQKKKGLEDARKRQEVASAQCHAEGTRLDEVLEFFSLDVPPSAVAPGSAGQPGKG
ncbi:MAG TPA: hypothetical protein VGM37_16220 [Armatimonadota bacterium]|jgi:hypothetical protein